jgi:hypothetical protein
MDVGGSGTGYLGVGERGRYMVHGGKVEGYMVPGGWGGGTWYLVVEEGVHGAWR